MQPRHGRRLELAKREREEIRGGSAPPAHVVAHRKPTMAEAVGNATTQRVLTRDEDLIAAERGGRLVARGGGAGGDKGVADNGEADKGVAGSGVARTPHGITLLAPTHRSSQYAPSASCGSRRDSFTPRLALRMILSSPTYLPPCGTPAPGRAGNG